jgi:hypothetical protein
METRIAEDNHAPVDLPNQPWRTSGGISSHVMREMSANAPAGPLKGVVSDIGGGTCPPHNQPPLIEPENFRMQCLRIGDVHNSQFSHTKCLTDLMALPLGER